MDKQPQLCIFATIAPLLPISECSVPGAYEKLIDSLVEDGYNGIEAQVSQILLIGKERFADKLASSGMRLIGKIYSSGGAAAVPTEAPLLKDVDGVHTSSDNIVHPIQGRSVQQHLAVWEAQLRECCTPQLRPLLVSVSSQGGRDAFHRGGNAEAKVFFTRCIELEKELGVLVNHETHRHRCLFSPWHAVEAVQLHPSIHLLGDLSHYCVVCEAPCGESELEESISKLLPFVRHMHARVGFEEGPQVPDPRMPKFAAQLEGHAAWWAAVFRHARARDDEIITVTPEFLPSPYCWTTTGLGVGSQEPVADVAEINKWMAGYVRDLFAKTMAT